MPTMPPARPFAAAEGWRRVSPPGDDTGAPPGDEEDAVANRMVELLEGILTELRECVQQGYVTTVTQWVPSIVPIEILFDPPLFSISLINDGAGSVEYRIPNRGNAQWVQLNPTELVIFNFIKGMVPSVALRTVPAGVGANVRVIGTF